LVLDTDRYSKELSSPLAVKSKSMGVSALFRRNYEVEVDRTNLVFGNKFIG
jgi:hypothetical protein